MEVGMEKRGKGDGAGGGRLEEVKSRLEGRQAGFHPEVGQLAHTDPRVHTNRSDSSHASGPVTVLWPVRSRLLIQFETHQRSNRHRQRDANGHRTSW